MPATKGGLTATAEEALLGCRVNAGFAAGVDAGVEIGVAPGEAAFEGRDPC